MNGKPGDDPAFDILQLGLPVYSPEIDANVRKLAKLMDLRRLQDFLYSLAGLPVLEIGAKVEQQLSTLMQEGHDRGWEIE